MWGEGQGTRKVANVSCATKYAHARDIFILAPQVFTHNSKLRRQRVIYRIAGKFGRFKIWRFVPKCIWRFLNLAGPLLQLLLHNESNYYLPLTVREKTVNEQRCRFSALIAAFVVTTFTRIFGARQQEKSWHVREITAIQRTRTPLQWRETVVSLATSPGNSRLLALFLRGVACVGASSSTALLTCLRILPRAAGHKNSPHALVHLLCLLRERAPHSRTGPSGCRYLRRAIGTQIKPKRKLYTTKPV